MIDYTFTWFKKSEHMESKTNLFFKQPVKKIFFSINRKHCSSKITILPSLILSVCFLPLFPFNFCNNDFNLLYNHRLNAPLTTVFNKYKIRMTIVRRFLFCLLSFWQVWGTVDDYHVIAGNWGSELIFRQFPSPSWEANLHTYSPVA